METNVSQNPPFLRQRRAAMAHTSLSHLAVPPEPSLFTYTKYGIQATNTSGPAQEILVLIALASSDGSCKSKHSCCPARAFAFDIHKVWYSSYKHRLASTRDSGTYDIVIFWYEAIGVICGSNFKLLCIHKVWYSSYKHKL